MFSVRRVLMPVVQVVHVIAMLYRFVPAISIVLVGVVSMFLTSSAPFVFISVVVVHGV